MRDRVGGWPEDGGWVDGRDSPVMGGGQSAGRGGRREAGCGSQFAFLFEGRTVWSMCCRNNCAAAEADIQQADRYIDTPDTPEPDTSNTPDTPDTPDTPSQTLQILPARYSHPDTPHSTQTLHPDTPHSLQTPNPRDAHGYRRWPTPHDVGNANAMNSARVSRTRGIGQRNRQRCRRTAAHCSTEGLCNAPAAISRPTFAHNCRS